MQKSSESSCSYMSCRHAPQPRVLKCRWPKTTFVKGLLSLRLSAPSMTPDELLRLCCIEWIRTCSESVMHEVSNLCVYRSGAETGDVFPARTVSNDDRFEHHHFATCPSAVTLIHMFITATVDSITFIISG